MAASPQTAEVVAGLQGPQGVVALVEGGLTVVGVLDVVVKLSGHLVVIDHRPDLVVGGGGVAVEIIRGGLDGCIPILGELREAGVPDLVGVLDVDVQVGVQRGIFGAGLGAGVGVDAVAAVLEQLGQLGDVVVGGVLGNVDP